MTPSTKSWFLAAARISAGPPMSMFSIAVGEVGAARDRRLERIEVDHDEVDRRDAVVLHRRRCASASSRAAEDAAVDLAGAAS